MMKPHKGSGILFFFRKATIELHCLDTSRQVSMDLTRNLDKISSQISSGTLLQLVFTKPFFKKIPIPFTVNLEPSRMVLPCNKIWSKFQLP